MQGHSLTALLGIQGFRVAAVERISSGPPSLVRIQLERSGQGYVCGGCGRPVAEGQEVRHLSLSQHQTVLRFLAPPRAHPPSERGVIPLQGAPRRFL